jgi:cytochrome b6-f complex iron-sulfur subunit
MATATAAKAKTAQAATGESVGVSAPSRREFLYYIWGASIALLTGELTAGILWFSLPRFREGEFGGIFRLDPAELPEAGVAPLSFPAGRFHVIVTQDDGLVTLYGVCTHLGCLPKWVPLNHRFECPCHGSKYQLNGVYIEGPAPRSLDRFKTTVTFADGSTAETDASGDPIPLAGRDDIVGINIDTGTRIKRDGRV